jgi:hypothetical protein
MNTVVCGLRRSTSRPCARWISRPTSTASSAEVSGHRERARPARGQADGRGDDRLGRLGHPQRLGNGDDPGHVAHPLGDPLHGLGPGGRAALLAVEHPQHDDAVPLPDVHGQVDLMQRGADVVLEHAGELLPVAALEDELAQLEQDARLVAALVVAALVVAALVVAALVAGPGVAGPRVLRSRPRRGLRGVDHGHLPSLPADRRGWRPASSGLPDTGTGC